MDGKPNPPIPNAPIQYGPMRTPAIKYAVTDGNLKGLNNLVIRSPANKAIDTDNNILITFTPFLNHRQVYDCHFIKSRIILENFMIFFYNTVLRRFCR
jgi:hypothetical protein